MIATIRNVWWTLLPWWWPEFIPLPPSWREAIERQVYDGMTQHEWFQAQIDVIHEAERRRAKERQP